jgi:superfamily I DNA and/or RNA helicase
MIVDLEKKGDKQMFVTEQVVHISENINGLWSVKFSTSQRIFNYNKSRLLYLTNPISVDLIEKGLYIKNRHITNVSELLRFDDGKHCFYHVIYNNGFTENLDGNEVYVTRTPIDKNGGTTWEYLNKLATETGLMTEEGDNILALQYGIIDVKRDNVPLAHYLGDKTKLATYRAPNTIYYPFGCNASQKKAVEDALTNQVSIIQGPPGTGKTQTILNIIANLLLAKKSVLVVSNNNSAVDNVAEKLEKEGLGFIVAKLGSVENKELFIANQKEYPQMEDWRIEETSSINQQIKQALRDVSLGFEGQSKFALLKTELDALHKEAQYDQMLHDVVNEHKWLFSKHSKKLMSIRLQYGILTEKRQKFSLLQKLKWSFTLGFKVYKFLKEKPETIINALETAYYVSRKREIENELCTIETSLKTIDIQQRVKELRQLSLKALKNTIAKRFTGERKRFTIKTIKPQTETFLKEYPVVLSTTYSAKACISKDMVFDYLIMDEASQVDIKTGALALSCAMNAVIVGDDKQLPNVISHEEEQALNAIQSTYHVDEKYQATSNSFLQSCVKVFTDAPVTLLREHYRCHPRIIDFCNQMFYNGELIAMTSGCHEDKVLQVIKTVPGNHARGHFNQREIDVIIQEVMPDYSESESVGIITPYRDQAIAINRALSKDIASTVHKFQGRECDVIIMSMVDNTPTDFSDDPNLMNVAISRAKTKLCIVVNGNEMPTNSNLAQLISYIQYNNFDINESKIHSVFDILYKQYTAERLTYEAQSSKISEYLSENIIYETLVKAIDKIQMSNCGIVCHYPLSRLITDFEGLNNQEIAFISNSLSHVDFLLYNSITKKPLMVIEVDGWKYHNLSEVQQSRDKLKDAILTKYDLKPYRISTIDTINVETIADMLSNNMRKVI